LSNIISPILHEANLIWFKHSNQYGLKSAGYTSNEIDYINANEIIKYSEFIDNDVELNEDGNLTFSQVIKLCDDDNKKRILYKLLINEFNDNGEMISLGIGEASISGLGVTLSGKLAFEARRVIYASKLPDITESLKSASSWIFQKKSIFKKFLKKDNYK